HLLGLNQSFKLLTELVSEMPILNEHSSLHVPLVRPLSEVGRCHERELFVHKNTFRMPGRAVGLVMRDRSRVVVHLGPFGPRPLLSEMCREFSQQLRLVPRVFPSASDVQKQSHSEVRNL